MSLATGSALSSEQQGVARWARDLFARDDWALVDTETTGLDRAAEVIDIAVLDRHGRVLLDTLVRPQGPITPGAAAVHHLAAADVADAPTFPEVWPALLAALRGRALLAYNVSFDERLLRQTAQRHRLRLPAVPTECVMRAYARFWGEPGRGGGRWQSLDRACAQQGLPPGNHRALGDCRATWALLRAMAARAADEPAPAPDEALLRVIARWAQVRREVKAVSLRVETLLSSADPHAVDGDVLTLVTAFEFHRAKLNEAESRLLLEAVLARVLGAPYRVRCVGPDEVEALGVRR
ncbi:MAG TPA: exonuclease domain-containing protein [Thermomicrobiales bacterium]|nr:exonuclease domain-containing protein [Thermomicrobiales bacterium]